MNRFFQTGARSLLLLPFTLIAVGCDLDSLTEGHRHHDCRGSNCQEVTRSYDLSGFDEIVCESGFHLTVRQSQTFRVVVTIPEWLEDELRVERDGHRLRIAIHDGWGADQAKAIVELPLLKRVEGSALTEIWLEGISTSGTVDVELSNASEIKGDLSAERTTLELSGLSRANLSGTTNELKLNLSAASNADLRDLQSRRADVELSSASTATIRVSDWLDVTAREISTLKYFGHPRLGRVEISSGSHLECED